MDERAGFHLVLAPREGVNDDVVRVLEWLRADGERVAQGQALVVLETTKTTFEIEASTQGYLYRLAQVGDEVAVGAAVAVLSAVPERPCLEPEPIKIAASRCEQVITNKARELMQRHGLALEAFADLAVVRGSDVEERVRGQAIAAKAPRFVGKELDPATDWDAPCDTPLQAELTTLLTALRRRMKAKFNRHVSTGNLLHDRWELAKEYGFGEGTSLYDDCLILGDVKMGRHCWAGPGTILDGQGGLLIGDYVDIGAGAHLYTHNTIERALTGHRAPMFLKATKIGNCCFIGPQAIIAPGTVLGDHCFVAAGSYVEGAFPAFSYVTGNPGRVVGRVEVRGERAHLRLVHEEEGRGYAHERR